MVHNRHFTNTCLWEVATNFIPAANEGKYIYIKVLRWNRCNSIYHGCLLFLTFLTVFFSRIEVRQNSGRPESAADPKCPTDSSFCCTHCYNLETTHLAEFLRCLYKQSMELLLCQKEQAQGARIFREALVRLFLNEVNFWICRLMQQIALPSLERPHLKCWGLKKTNMLSILE